MATTMKVDELRAELSKRGLSTFGIKPTLARRLESALREESNRSTADGTDSATTGKKREREIGDEIGSVEKFQAMSIQQLRKQASLRGISSNGSKKELVERFCAAVVDGHDKEEKEENKELEEVKKEKLVTATKKGSAVLDQWLPDHIKNHYHVLEMGNEIYDAMLNQTNVGDNKFYVLQALEADGAGSYMVYNRWGRVGVKGQDKLFGPYSCRESAIQEFEQKFLAKTKNHFQPERFCFSSKVLHLAGNGLQ